MKIHIESRCVVGMLVLMLLVPGCKKATTSTGSPPAGNTTSPFAVPEGGGGGVMATLPAARRTVALKDLAELGKLYVLYTQTNNGPPASAEALGIDRDAPMIYQATKDGDLIVYWNVDGTKTPSGASNTILAHPKPPFAIGMAVPVLMFDGTAHNMTPDEFNKAPKGGK